ncbi:MAG: YbjN domain-containing protein [Albidovulum sp.]|nr:YbjN domain-containing protein [Albidovulum sp.]
MTIAPSFVDGSEFHPIDLVESLATRHEWNFDRYAEDQIDLTIEGNWRIYAISIAWSEFEELLKLVCSFDLDAASAIMPRMLETVNRANDMNWTGAFSYKREIKQMFYRYGLVLGDEATISTTQIERLMSAAFSLCERYYPAFQVVAF